MPRAVARGRTNAEIGQELFLSISTVKFHLASLMSKLAARNRVELACRAYESRRMRSWMPRDVERLIEVMMLVADS